MKMASEGPHYQIKVFFQLYVGVLRRSRGYIENFDPNHRKTPFLKNAKFQFFEFFRPVAGKWPGFFGYPN